jgi:hypothetical protein
MTDSQNMWVAVWDLMVIFRTIDAQVDRCDAERTVAASEICSQLTHISIRVPAWSQKRGSLKGS